MKKNIIFLIALLVIIVLCLIPFKRKETVFIKVPFLKVYRELLVARNWANWNAVVKRDFTTDSSKVIFTNNPDGFNINSPSAALHTIIQASNFSVDQQGLTGDNSYIFTVWPDKNRLWSKLNVILKTNFIGYIRGLITGQPFEVTSADRFKNYMEDNDIYYGYHIYKIRVPQEDLVVIRKQVPKSAQFIEAANSYTDLSKFMIDNHLKKMQPVIAQFIPKGKDSAQVNVGFFIDKEIKSTGHVTYVHMPKGGPLVVIDYKGKFNQRGKAYAALHHYFSDHAYQSAILPFETYYGDILPKSETDDIYLRINFTSFQ